MRHALSTDLLDAAAGHGGHEAAAHAASCGVCARRLHQARTVVTGLQEERAVRELLAKPAAAAPPAFAEQIRAVERAEQLARDVLTSEAPVASLRRYRDDPDAAWLLLFAAQRGATLAVQAPEKALELAEALDAGATALARGPVPVPEIRAEAALLASQALLNQGRIDEALERSESARPLFAEAVDDGFGRALCDYFSGNVLAYSGRYAAARRLLVSARRAFAEFGQDHWIGRAELAFGTLLALQGRNAAALPHLDNGLAMLDPDEDANAYAAGHVNRASLLAHQELYDAARAGYAQALAVSKRHGFHVLTYAVRMGLTEIDFLRGEYGRALPAYQELAAAAERQGLQEQVLLTRLFAAECQARLGHVAELQASLRELKRRVQPNPFQAPALDELFAYLEKGDLDAGLIRHVRESLTGEQPYQRYRQTA